MYIGLSGGIGCGKTTVAKMLGDLGAVIIDADAIAKEVLEPGQAGYERVVLEFGTGVLDETGNIDRRILAETVFQNDSKLAQLEDIVHPAVIARVASIREVLPQGSTVVYDTPLLVEKKLQNQFDKVVIVTSDLDLRKQRLEQRGLLASDIEARMSNQATDLQRAAVADFVIVNNGTLQELREQVIITWNHITA